MGRRKVFSKHWCELNCKEISSVLAPALDGFTVETLLGSGACGVVLLIRDRAPVDAKEPRRYALKLQRRMKRAALYESIWQRDEACRRGHDLFVEMLGSYTWPKGREFFLHDSLEGPVVWSGPDGRPRQRFCYGTLMEYCPLGTLDEYLPRHMRRGLDDSTPEAQEQWARFVVSVVSEVLCALDFLHNGRGIVYNDLKPKKVLLTGCLENPHVRLCDFGLADDGDSEVWPFESQALNCFFKPAPEIQLGLVTPASDVYGLGSLVWVMLHGCELFRRAAEGLVRTSSSQAQLEDEFQCWLAPHKFPIALQPTPDLLQELSKQERCPLHSTSFIKRARELHPKRRPGLEELKALPLFQVPCLALTAHTRSSHGGLGSMQRFFFTTLGGLEILEIDVDPCDTTISNFRSIVARHVGIPTNRLTLLWPDLGVLSDSKVLLSDLVEGG